MRAGLVPPARHVWVATLLAGAALACASLVLPALAAGAALACASRRATPPGAAQAIAFDQASVGEALAETLARMREAFRVGDEERARSELALARSLDPPSSVADYLDRFEDVLDGRALARALERSAHVEAVRNEVTLGDPIPVQFVLPNVTVAGKEGTIVVQRSVGGGLFDSTPRATTRLIARITLTDLDAFGAESTGSAQREVPFDDDWVAEVGAAYRLDWTLETGPPSGAAARLVTIEAEAFVAQIRFADRPLFVSRIPFAPATVLVLPSGYEALAASPLESLESLLARNEAAVDSMILPAALLVPADQRETAVRRLAAALPGAPPARARAIVAALRQLTGDQELGLDLAAWLGWASRLR